MTTQEGTPGRGRWLVGAIVLAGLALSAPAPAATDWVGTATCRTCHETHYAAWAGSHHDLAMQPATDDTVLGDFDDTTVTHRGARWRFFRRGGGFWVETGGPDGTVGSWEITHTFGIDPLQQYLVEIGRGRRQALTVAWDTRPRQRGGQRWFHLYPDEDTPAGDELHWTAPAHTWNFACAECHSTNLRKGYDAAADRYDTRWSDIDVGCEACHGPGARHVEAARRAAGDGVDGPRADSGLSVTLTGPGRWRRSPGDPVARRAAAAPGASETELCGRCHARRTQLSEDWVPGAPLLDTHRVELLRPGRYHVDGQILDEVYVYGSFRQSRMHAAGVTCSDCHDPHTLRLRADGNALCVNCHAPARYDGRGHHFHDAAGAGAHCVACHMPARTYMQIDPRRDHSMRVPRPDLSLRLGVPNACTQCHHDRSDAWAADQVAAWYGTSRSRRPHPYADALEAARTGAPGAGAALVALVRDAQLAGIVRATAAEALATHPTPETLDAVRAALADADPLVRRAAVTSVEPLPPRLRLPLLAPLLTDAVRGVRVDAARALADVRPESLDDRLAAVLHDAFDDYVASEMVGADRAEHWVNLGNFRARRGEADAAERAYGEARRRNPRFAPAWVNQADLERARGREADALRTLRDGLVRLPDEPSLHHALGLALVRAGDRRAALAALGRAAELAPDRARFGYVYGVALADAGRPRHALRAWKRVLASTPNDVPTLVALAQALARHGDRPHALRFAERAAALVPGDDDLRRLRDELRAG